MDKLDIIKNKVRLDLRRLVYKNTTKQGSCTIRKVENCG